jgi:hypothetical protein
MWHCVRIDGRDCCGPEEEVLKVMIETDASAWTFKIGTKHSKKQT